VLGNCRFAQNEARLGATNDDLYSWLGPDGQVVPVGPKHKHVDWAYKNFPGDSEFSPLQNAWKAGWYRITYYGKSLYAHNDFVLPTDAQRGSLIDLAITMRMDEVVLDHRGNESIIWSESNRV
jgi:hypothetical protein